MSQKSSPNEYTLSHVMNSLIVLQINVEYALADCRQSLSSECLHSERERKKSLLSALDAAQAGLRAMDAVLRRFYAPPTPEGVVPEHVMAVGQ